MVLFDPAKDAINTAKHGVSLARASEMNLESATVIEDDRQDYGERRYRAFGRIDDLAYCFVFTIREGAIRAISLRRAHQKEIRRHAS
ncbi:BrnT family toxin [Brevundimonas sp. PAMC22021]|uniref:BrnT family toxin n=1 Tax=Brevundimonas sp. PAMC22021 TaxID=2861285 RepID=UPI001C63373F|nr:BrnT family toxin [Brevundimonas sp. PAMC22021]QYF85977.1 BrnT family toxin [Brevundimonas sp. PAMC22021]